MLVDSHIRRKRWEYREQAIANLSLQAEAMGASSGKKKTETVLAASNERVFRPNNGGINYGTPPLAELAKLGLGTN